MRETKYDKLRVPLNKLRTTILLHGPITLYEAKEQLHTNSTTADRHLKILLREKELKLYDTKPHWSGQTKKFYGYTFYGFLRSFRIPGGVTHQKFTTIMEIWLRQKRFRFFIPNDETLRALSVPQIADNLARLCSLIASMFGDAEDFLEDLGYEVDPEEVIKLAFELARDEYGKRFLEACRVLCNTFPSYRSYIQAIVDNEQTRIDEFRNGVFGKGNP